MKKVVLKCLVIASIAVLLGMGLSACGNTNAQNAQGNSSNMSERWEYMMFGEGTDSESGRNRATQRLNELGLEGWELIGTGGYNGYVFLLKRKL